MTLHDGRQVDVSSEDWRHECEARTVLSWPLWARKEHLIGVGDKRGQVARQRLESTMTTLWVKRKREDLMHASQDERAEILESTRRETREMSQQVMELWDVS